MNDLKRDFVRGFERFREGGAMAIASLVLSKNTRMSMRVDAPGYHPQ